MTDAEYSKVLSYDELVFSNIGYIVGAGIFVLIGRTVGIAGSSAWISVLLAGLFILIVSDAYIKVHAEFHSNYPEIQAIGKYCSESVGYLSMVVLLIGIIFIIYVVALAFGEYMTAFTDGCISAEVSTVVGFLLAVAFNTGNVEMTSDVNKIITISGLVGLGLIIILGIGHIFKNHKTAINNLVIRSKDFSVINIFYGAFIFLFAYTGFDMIIRLDRESEDAEDDIPAAINTSIWIIIGLYLSITIITIALFGNGSSLKNSTHPLVDVIKELTDNRWLIKFIEYCGIALTWTTVLLSITYASRLTKELADETNDLKFLGELDSSTHIPLNATLMITLIIILLLLGDIDILKGAVVANSCILTIMMLVYLCSWGS